MADCVGIDQARTGSASCYQVATGKLGQLPVFWGRYFKEPEIRRQFISGQLEADFL